MTHPLAPLIPISNKIKPDSFRHVRVAGIAEIQYTYRLFVCILDSVTRSKRTQQERSDKTRQRVIAAARGLFTEKGFAETGTEEIALRAGVSRGALYHQFADKSELFLAVFEAVETNMIERVGAALDPTAEPLDHMHTGCDVFLDVCKTPEMMQIALTDAPAILGWEKWREIDARYGLGLIRAVLTQLSEQGRLPAERVGSVAHLLLGAISEAAMLAAHADDAEIQRVRENLHWMIDRILGAND